MLRLRDEEGDEEYSDDITRITRVFAARGHVIDRRLARDAWKSYSNGWAAGWLMLPPGDAELFDNCMSQLVDE